MIKVLFICHGNICRSPMAEYIFRRIVRRAAQNAASSTPCSIEGSISGCRS